MICKDFRPQFFREVAGNDLAKEALKAIVKDKSKAPKVILLHGAYGSSKCVLGNTRVFTKDGYLPIKSLMDSPKEGFNNYTTRILSDCGWENTSHFYYEKYTKVNLVRLADGTTINGTDKHKVLGFRYGKVDMFRLDALELGDYIFKNTNICDHADMKVDYDLCYLIGYMSSQDNCIFRYANGFTKVQIFTGENKIIQRILKSSANKLVSLHKDLPDLYLKVMDLITPEYRSLNSFIPRIEKLFTYNAKSRIFFLEGLFNDFKTDSQGFITYSTSDQRLAKYLEDMCDSLGLIYNVVTTTDGDKFTTNDTDVYKINIPTCFKTNAETLNITLNTTSHYARTLNIKLEKFLITQLEKARKINKVSTSHPLYHIFRKVKAQKSITYKELMDLYEGLEFLPEAFVEIVNSGVPCEIIAKDVTYNDVYDLTVPGSHHFYGQGVLNHNTTNSRIFAKAVNCLNPQDGEPCGECEVCKTPIQEAIFYSEYDSAVVGNIDTIRELRDTFLYTIKGMTKVIVLDEIHVASKPAQTALLKVLEEAPEGVIFILATTHPHQLLPTIVSRSLEIPITRVSPADVIKNISTVSEKIGINPSDKVKELIAYKSKGHMRDAHMLLDMYVLLGEESFIEAVKSSREYLTRYLVAILRKDKKYLEQALEGLMTIPVANVKDDWQQLLLDLAKEMTNPSDTPTGKLVRAFTAPNIMKLIKLASGEWFESSFSNDVALQTYLLCIYQIFTK